jgi:dTDP-glucose 4,6-dehydratase
VDDHAAGIEAALRNGTKGEVYNIAPGQDNEEQTEAIIERVRAQVEKGEIEKVNDRDNYDLRYWMSPAKAKAELGWEAKYDLDSTVSRTVEWYLDNPEWIRLAIAAQSKI